jgi:hypothetical protein
MGLASPVSYIWTVVPTLTSSISGTETVRVLPSSISSVASWPSSFTTVPRCLRSGSNLRGLTPGLPICKPNHHSHYDCHADDDESHTDEAGCGFCETLVPNASTSPPATPPMMRDLRLSVVDGPCVSCRRTGSSVSVTSSATTVANATETSTSPSAEPRKASATVTEMTHAPTKTKTLALPLCLLASSQLVNQLCGISPVIDVGALRAKR